MQQQSLNADIFLSTSGMVEILHHIRDNPCCRRSSVYSGVSRNTTMPEKFLALEGAGLIETVRADGGLFLDITGRGCMLLAAVGELDGLVPGGCRFFRRRHTAEIVMYIFDHPGCRRTEIYHRVTRNVHTRETIEGLIEAGIVEVDGESHGLLRLSEPGSRVYDVLKDIEDVLGGSPTAQPIKTIPSDL